MNEDDMPEQQDPNEALGDFFKMFGGEKEAEEFMKTAESLALDEAWASLFEMYQGLMRVGFSKTEANNLVATYLFKILSGGTI